MRDWNSILWLIVKMADNCLIVAYHTTTIVGRGGPTDGESQKLRRFIKSPELEIWIVTVTTNRFLDVWN